MTDTIKHEPDCAYVRSREQFPDGWCCGCTCGASTAKPPQPDAALPEEVELLIFKQRVESHHQHDDSSISVNLGCCRAILSHLTAQAEALAAKDAEIKGLVRALKKLGCKTCGHKSGVVCHCTEVCETGEMWTLPAGLEV